MKNHDNRRGTPGIKRVTYSTYKGTAQGRAETLARKLARADKYGNGGK